MHRPKWMTDKPPVRKKSIKKEQGLAKQLSKGKTYSNSGARFRQNDISSEDMDIEHKYTEKNSFVLKAAELEKLRQRSDTRKVPVFVIEFESLGKKYAVVELNDILK